MRRYFRKRATRKYRKKRSRRSRLKPEVKQAFYANENLFNSTISSTGDVLRLIPDINQGVADGYRIGDKIQPLVLRIRGFVQTNSDYVPTRLHSRHAVRLMILSVKNYGSFDTAYNNSALTLPNLLKKGTTVSAFNGAPSDLYADINTNVFNLHYNRVMYLTEGVNASNSGYFGENLRSLRFFRKTIRFRRPFLYENTQVGISGARPTNCGMFMVLGYVNLAYGDTADVISTNIAMQYDTKLSYFDS